LISASELQMKYRRIFIWKNKTKKNSPSMCSSKIQKRNKKEILSTTMECAVKKCMRAIWELII